MQHDTQLPYEDLANILHSRNLYHSPMMSMQTVLIPPGTDHSCLTPSEPLEPIAEHSASALTSENQLHMKAYFFITFAPQSHLLTNTGRGNFFLPLKFLNKSQFCLQNRAVGLHHQFSIVFVAARHGSTLKHNDNLNVHKLPWKNDGPFQSMSNSWHEIRGDKRLYFTPFRASLPIPLQALTVHMSGV